MKLFVLNTLAAIVFWSFQVAAYPTDCLAFKEQWPKEMTGDAVSGEQILSTEVTENMEMYMRKITTCVDEFDQVIGLQFQLVSQLNEAVFDLPSIGTIDGTCDTKNLFEADIQKVKVSQSKSVLNAIHFFNKEGVTLAYGSLDSDNLKEWNFSDELELIGLYG